MGQEIPAHRIDADPGDPQEVLEELKRKAAAKKAVEAIEREVSVGKPPESPKKRETRDFEEGIPVWTEVDGKLERTEKGDY